MKRAWPPHAFFASEPARVARVYLITRFFYACLVFFACQGFVESITLSRALKMDPLWPLFWVRWTGQEHGAVAAQLLYLGGPLLAVWKTDSRATRILAFLGCLMGIAFDNSFGKINNHLHLWTMTAFLLIFLPSRRDSLRFPASGEAALRVFWGAQAAILLTYTMSGVAKLMGAAVQLRRGDTSTLFSPDALARQVAERLLSTHETSVLGNWIVTHPMWGALPFWGAVYLEVFALAAAFRFSLHKVWALGLVLMHIGIFMAMNVTFSHSILLLCLMFAASPFAASPTASSRGQGLDVGRILRDLPLFGLLTRVFSLRRKARANAEAGL